MSGKQQKGSPEKRSSKRLSDKGGGAAGGSSPSPAKQSSPQKHYRHKRRRRARASSSSSDGLVHEVRRDMRHMERLLLHAGKLHVFRAYFEDPTLEFYTRPEGRRRHPAGRARPPRDDNRQSVGLALFHQAAAEAVEPLAVQVDEEGPPSVVSSRGLSPGSSFATFSVTQQSPSESDFEMVPFDGLPPISESPEPPRARPPKPDPPTDVDDSYMASVSASDSDEQQQSQHTFGVEERLNRMAVSSSGPLPPPEPMSVSSDSPSPPQDSDD